jgi:hypothetical protein
VGLIVPQRHRNRSRGRAGTFEIPPQRVDDGLDPLRGSQPAEPDGERSGEARPNAEGHSSGRETALAGACCHGPRLPPQRPLRNPPPKARQAVARSHRMDGQLEGFHAMRLARFIVTILVAGFMFSAVDKADAQICLPTSGYGNVGYSAGYSIQQVGWCGPRFGGWCGPRWGEQQPRMAQTFHTQEPATSLSRRRLIP